MDAGRTEVRAYVAIGSNIEPEANVRLALFKLAQQARLAGVSMVYRSAALGRPEQPPYFNCVAAIETRLPPLQLKHALLRPIEQRLGRQRGADRYAARPIDLDLVAYGDLVLEKAELRLPDPDILERPFLAIPLCELAPELVVGGRRIADIAAGMGEGGIEPMPDYSRQLRAMLVMMQIP